MIKKTETNYCLKKNNTFGINVKCNTLHRVKSENDIFQVLNSNAIFPEVFEQHLRAIFSRMKQIFPVQEFFFE